MFNLIKTISPAETIRSKPKANGYLSKIDVRAYTMILALLGIWAIFTYTTQGAFLTSRNLSNLFRQMSITSILAIGMVFVIVAGHIDLSVGSLMGLTGGVGAILQVWYGWQTIPAIFASLLIGLLAGLWQGWWVAYKKVPAFIVTLGGMMVFRGILIGISHGETVSPLLDSFKQIGQAYVPESTGFLLAFLGIIYVIYVTVKQRYTRIKYGFTVPSLALEIMRTTFYAVLIGLFVYLMNDYQGIPVPVLIVVVMAFIFTGLATKTRFGRYVYAIGGNSEAARLSGINIRTITLTVFVISGLLAALSGILLTARLNGASVAAGQNAELDAIAACVIGGTSLMGGTGSIGGAMIGALVMASLDNGLSMMNTPTFWQFIVKGLILVLAVWIDIATKTRAQN